MDQDRAIKLLERWVVSAQAALDGTGLGFAYDDSPGVLELQEREDSIGRIVQRVNGLKAAPKLMIFHDGSSRRAVSLSEGIDLCKYAIGRLKHDAETREVLGSNAPTMAADALHPTIWESVSGRWEAGHYSDAVQRAATFLNAEIQDLTGRRDISDNALMGEAFSLAPPVPGKPRLRWPGPDDDQTVRAMRVGILNYSQGVFSAIRNPATHSTEDMGRQEALEQLAALSMLARWVDECETVFADDGLKARLQDLAKDL
jgi:hypothetical protein